MLLEANQLKRRASGVFVRDGFEPIAYSDGEESERYLAEVLSGATDVSSTSAELELRIRDWPSEYHLSSKRANIVRGLVLPGEGRVLELGCGCGAITRYLGEQGLDVDAVEGSRVRAELAAMRCRGLDNVNISCANFNDLELPASAYDVIMLVGVVEYAARFWPGGSSDEDAVSGLLRSLKKCLRRGGVIIVAIENRTGLKYVLGAHEDHYARRYVGIHGYVESAGIRTYTRNEWSVLISRAGIAATRYLFPFPDYKVPTVLLSEGYAGRNPQAYAHLEGIASRDYIQPLETGAIEPVFWQAASANGSLGAFANSLLILMSDAEEVLDAVAGIDFIHLPDFRRKRRYCLMVRKRAASAVVERRRVVAAEEAAASGLLQHVRDEPWIDGTLLSVEWSRSLLIEPWAGRFKQHLSHYYDYLADQPLNIDLVPNNIMVLDGGEYRHFDHEWEVTFDLDRDYVLFRALMLFTLRHKSVLKEFLRIHNLYTVNDFILFAFGALGLDGQSRLRQFVAREREFQQQVNVGGAAASVEEQLALRLDQPVRVSPVYARVYWRTPDQAYSEQRSLIVEAPPLRETARLVFELPDDAVDLSHIRFDPCDEKKMDDMGFLQIAYLGIEANIGGDTTRIMALEGGQEISANTVLSDMVFNQAEYGDVFAVVGDNPEIECSLATGAAPGAQTGYKVIVECSHIRSPQYRLVRDRFLVQEEVLKKSLAQEKAAAARLEQELAEIKSSRLWKAASRYRALRSRAGAGS